MLGLLWINKTLGCLTVSRSVWLAASVCSVTSPILSLAASTFTRLVGLAWMPCRRQSGAFLFGGWIRVAKRTPAPPLRAFRYASTAIDVRPTTWSSSSLHLLVSSFSSPPSKYYANNLPRLFHPSFHPAHALLRSRLRPNVVRTAAAL